MSNDYLWLFARCEESWWPNQMFSWMFQNDLLLCWVLLERCIFSNSIFVCFNTLCPETLNTTMHTPKIQIYIYGIVKCDRFTIVLLTTHYIWFTNYMVFRLLLNGICSFLVHLTDWCLAHISWRFSNSNGFSTSAITCWPWNALVFMRHSQVHIVDTL